MPWPGFREGFRDRTDAMETYSRNLVKTYTREWRDNYVQRTGGFLLETPAGLRL